MLTFSIAASTHYTELAIGKVDSKASLLWNFDGSDFLLYIGGVWLVLAAAALVLLVWGKEGVCFFMYKLGILDKYR